MDYAAAIKWLYSTQLFGIKLGLETMQRIVAALDLPGEGQRFIHVAGTNGKGSTCAMIEAICRAAGWRAGLYSSPHLISFCERIRVDGATIPEAAAAARLTTLRRLVENWQPHPTFFEIATTLALMWFRDAGVEVVAFETGLGGRLDATNAILPAVSVITPIALDHQEWLGDSLAQIAFEKAGIIKRGVPVVVAPQEPEALAVLRRVARERCSPMTMPATPWTRGPIGLKGRHQAWNAALAVAAVRASGLKVSAHTIRKSLATITWPARFQRVRDRLVIDGSHNPHGAAALAETWRDIFGVEKATIIFGVLAQKDYREIIETLRPIAAGWIFTAVNSSRGVSPSQLAPLVPGSRVAESCAEALSLAGVNPPAATVAAPFPILICGSLYLAGEALALLEKEKPIFERSAQ